MVNLIHVDRKSWAMSLCRPERRTRDSMFPKWWCFVCNRYALPDKRHVPQFRKVSKGGE